MDRIQPDILMISSQENPILLKYMTMVVLGKNRFQEATINRESLNVCRFHFSMQWVTI